MANRPPLNRALGVGGFLRLRGKMYQCKPLRLRHFAEAKAFLVSLIPDPLKELSEIAETPTYQAFPPEVQKALALKALELREERKAATASEASQWVNSDEGALFFFWCMVRDNHPELATLEAVLQVFPPGDDEKGLSIPECDLIRQKIDEITLGPGQLKPAEDTSKKKKTPPQKKKKR